MLTAPEVKKLATGLGIDLVGIASADRFAGLPADAHPASVLPQATAVIVLGHRVPRGSLRGHETGHAHYVLSANSPMQYALTRTYQFCCALETEGWEAFPMYPHSSDVREMGVPVAPDKPAPNVVLDIEYAAHAAGLGEMGRGGFFLTPEFGPRQFFTAVITDLPLEADAPFAGSVCDACGLCVEACPALALSREELVEHPLSEGVATVYALRKESCRVCPGTGGTGVPYATGQDPWRLGAPCGRACVAHLEDSGLLTRRFHSPFRNEEASSC
ncbi:MAG: epoxyqueuosine reductase [candidate division WS1 bacterium]|nr:epoxyqueuosine reductase [candidate division WS1 bacterium]